MQLRKKLLYGAAVFATASVLTAVGRAPASAGTVTFDFSALVATGGYSQCTAGSGAGTGSNCLSANPATYTTGGVTVRADAFAGNTISSVPQSTVSQRFSGGANGAGEQGLGVKSGTDTITDGSSLEIGPASVSGLNEYLVLDNSSAVAAGYTELSLLLGSLQSSPNEGGVVDFYSAAGLPGGNQNFSGATLIASTTLGGGVEQVVNIPVADNTKPYLVISFNPNQWATQGNVLVENEIFTTPTAAPEPASLALLGTALAGLGLLRRRRKSA